MNERQEHRELHQKLTQLLDEPKSDWRQANLQVVDHAQQHKTPMSLVRVDLTNPSSDSGQAMEVAQGGTRAWVPKSQVFLREPGDTSGIVYMPDWLIREKGLNPHVEAKDRITVTLKDELQQLADQSKTPRERAQGFGQLVDKTDAMAKDSLSAMRIDMKEVERAFEAKDRVAGPRTIAQLGAQEPVSKEAMALVKRIELHPVICKRPLSAVELHHITHSARLRDVEHFSARSQPAFDDRAMARLVQNPRIANLHTLDVANTKISDAGIKALSSSPHVAKLAQLDLSNTQVSAKGLDELGRSPHLSQLTRLQLPKELGQADWSRLLSSPALPRLEPPADKDIRRPTIQEFRDARAAQHNQSVSYMPYLKHEGRVLAEVIKLDEGEFRMLDTGQRLQLVPNSPQLDKHVGRHVSIDREGKVERIKEPAPERHQAQGRSR